MIIKPALPFFSILILGILPLFWTGCGPDRPKSSKKGSDSWHYQKGMLQYERGDYDSAIRYYQKAIQINPDGEEAYLDLGILYEDYRGDATQAMECYQKFLLLRPTGDKADMVKEWLMKLAVKNKPSAPPVLMPALKDVTVALNQVETQTQVENYEKQLRSLRAQLDAATKNQEGLEQTLKEREQQEAATQKQLKENRNTIDELQSKIEEMSREKAQAAQKSQKSLDESSTVKREMARFEGEQVALKQKVEKELESQRKENQKINREKEAQEAEVEKALEEVQKLRREKEAALSRSRADLERMRQAFAQAAEERARLEKQFVLHEAEIKNLKSLLARASAQRAAETLPERLPLQRQIPQPQPTPLRSSSPTPATPVKKDYELITYHRVKRGETLMMIAGYDHIYSDRSKWKIIYEANKDNIDDPNVLVPGQILLVPR